MASVTNRYTEALFEVAQAEGSTDAVAQDLQVLGIGLAERSLRMFLENPEVERKRKAQVLEAILQVGDRTPHPRTLRFLEVLLARGRQGVLADIVRAFRARALDVRGEVEGRLDTAMPLGDDELASLQASLSALVGKKVLLESRIDEGLLGGFRVRVADRMFDASLKGQIEALGRKLKGMPVSELQRGS